MTTKRVRCLNCDAVIDVAGYRFYLSGWVTIYRCYYCNSVNTVETTEPHRPPKWEFKDSATDNTEIFVTATWGTCDKCGVTYALNTVHVCEPNYVVVYNARLVIAELTKIEDLLTQILDKLTLEKLDGAE